MLRIDKISISEGDEFRDYILGNPRTLLYAEPRFMVLIAEHLSALPFWLVARRGNVIVGLLPFLVKEGPLGPAYNSLAYYGSNGGVIQNASDTEAKVALIEAFYCDAKDACAVSATIITNPLECDAEFYDKQTGYTFRDERIGQITHFPLIARDDDLVTHFQDPRPRNIRRAIKEGVKTDKGHKESLNFLYSTHVDNITAIGGLPKARSFFEAIEKHMVPEDWAIFTATIQGKPIAALLLFYFNKTVEYFTPVIVEEYRHTQALSLTIYAAMQDAIKKGYANWNWGGTWLSQGGVYDFKKRWGTTEYRYFYYTRLYNSLLTTCEPVYLQEHYPGFFLIPYKNLAGDKEISHA